MSWSSVALVSWLPDPWLRDPVTSWGCKVQHSKAECMAGEADGLLYNKEMERWKGLSLALHCILGCSEIRFKSEPVVSRSVLPYDMQHLCLYTDPMGFCSLSQAPQEDWIMWFILPISWVKRPGLSENGHRRRQQRLEQDTGHWAHLNFTPILSLPSCASVKCSVPSCLSFSVCKHN